MLRLRAATTWAPSGSTCHHRAVSPARQCHLGRVRHLSEFLFAQLQGAAERVLAVTVQRACGDEGGAQLEEEATGLCGHGGQDRADLRLNAGAQSRSPRPNFSLRPFDCVPHTPRRPLHWLRTSGRGAGSPPGAGVRCPERAVQGGRLFSMSLPPRVSLLSAWFTVAPGPAMVQPEAEGGKGRGTKCSLPPSTRLTSDAVSTRTRGSKRLSGGHAALQGSLEGAVRAALCAWGLILEALGLES